MNDPASLHDAFNGHTGRGEQSETDEFNEIQHLRFLLKSTRAELERTREYVSMLEKQLQLRWDIAAKNHLSGGTP